MTTSISTTSVTASNRSEIFSSTDVPGSSNWMASSTPRIVFLSVFVSFGFVGNLLLIITVCQSQRFRSKAFFIFVINLAVINICECVLNMSILLASSIINEWNFGDIACRMSSFFLNLIFIETILGLTVCTADRYIAMRFKNRYSHVVSTPRIAIVITLTWVQSFSFCIPVAVGVIPTSVNNYIVYCVISKSSSVIYSVFNALLCFIVPLILMILFFVNIIRIGYNERFQIRNLISQHNYDEDPGEEPRIKQDIRHSNMTGTICAAWLVLEGPHIVTSYLKRFQDSPELGDISTEDMRYVWYVDLVLLWLRFSYSLALPIASFTWNKDLWKSFKDMILCRKNNAIVDESLKKSDSDILRLERKIKEERLKEKEVIISAREQRVFQIPVLFATSHGVRIQTFSQSDISDNEVEDKEKTKSTINGQLRGKNCDVIASQDNLNNLESDTSDYDSGNELDPFSVSHPISVKQINRAEISDRKRSLSEPEVRNKIESTNMSNGRSVGSTSEGDSGLDLSTGTYSKNIKNKLLFQIPSDKIIAHDTQTQLQTEIINTKLFPKSPVQHITEIKKDNFVNEYANFPTDTEKEGSESHTMNQSSKDSGLNDKLGEFVTLNNIPESNEQSCDSLTKLNRETILDATDSPLIRKKQRKRKTKSFDTQSISSVTSLTGTPPRPPPRLAPIAAIGLLGLKTLYSGTGRPGSSCSSQCSIGDSQLDGRYSALSCDSFSDIASLKSETVQNDNQSVSSFSMRVNKHKKKSKHRQTLPKNALSAENPVSNELLQLDCKREIKCVPEEVLTPTDFHVVDCSNADNIFQKINGAKLDIAVRNFQETNGAKEDNTVEQDECMNNEAAQSTRNDPARKKRREKTSAREKVPPSSLLSDSVGYQRLVPET